MNRILLSASLALALSGTLVFAQATAAPTPAGMHFHHHSRNPQQEAARLSKKLNLSPDQTTKLEPILADRDQKMAALKSNASLSPEELKQQRLAIHQDTKQQLSAVLTPDQLQQMKAMRHHRAPTQSQPQAAPPAGL
jgi:periplasmic protein CpxP/Spy